MKVTIDVTSNGIHMNYKVSVEKIDDDGLKFYQEIVKVAEKYEKEVVRTA